MLVLGSRCRTPCGSVAAFVETHEFDVTGQSRDATAKADPPSLVFPNVRSVFEGLANRPCPNGMDSGEALRRCGRGTARNAARQRVRFRQDRRRAAAPLARASVLYTEYAGSPSLAAAEKPFADVFRDPSSAGANAVVAYPRERAGEPVQTGFAKRGRRRDRGVASSRARKANRQRCLSRHRHSCYA